MTAASATARAAFGGLDSEEWASLSLPRRQIMVSPGGKRSYGAAAVCGGPTPGRLMPSEKNLRRPDPLHKGRCPLAAVGRAHAKDRRHRHPPNIGPAEQT